MRRYFNTAQAAEHMGVSVDLIRDAIKDGRLIAKRTSPTGPFVITSDALDEWYAGWVDA